MRRITWTQLVILSLAILPMFSCGGGDSQDVDAPIVTALSPDELKVRIAKYAPVKVGYDESVLSRAEKQALEKIVQAGGIMDEIFLRQVWAGNVELRAQLQELAMQGQNDPESWAAQNRELVMDLNRFFQINFGPWDRLDEDSAFIGSDAKPASANYYPEDMGKDEFEGHISTHPELEDNFRGFFTLVRRGDGGLEAIPYAVEFREYLEPAAQLLNEAADILTDPANQQQYREGVNYDTLARFLRSRAEAFATNDYVQSDMDWMDVRHNIIDVTIGPYETYEDGLNGYKAAFEAFIAIRHPADSAKLEGLKQYLQLLENSLPIPDEHKNPNRGSESPISVVDLVYAGGDTKAGVQTLAFNLPNDETVREAKGSKKVMLKNISQAKFDKILKPIAHEVLDKKQMKYVSFDAYFNNVLMHEMAHGLGPGTIARNDGSETTVSRELKELYAPLEEAKADILGLYCRKILVKEGFFPQESMQYGYVSFLPGFFRAIRFGATAAHGRANMIEFNFMREQGAIVLDEKTDRFSVVIEKMPDAVQALSNALLMIQARGDYRAAAAFIEEYGQMGPDVQRMLERLSNVPVDIVPEYSAEQYVKNM